jgi:hypothetical protein
MEAKGRGLMQESREKLLKPQREECAEADKGSLE